MSDYKIGNEFLPSHPAPAAPQAEPPLWKRLRDAGFTPRDNRIECDECGKRFTPQFLPIHKCEEQAVPKRDWSTIAACSPANIAAILAHVEAQEADIERLRKLLCKCDMRTRLVGDGCEFCNPTLADELAKEQR